ncbi:MAG: M23 family metallopeptidase [Candidatus Omnitrophota bacterium]|nr:M23 family metallopeptidase [Candidatus Omnitrophota bacterium]
MKKISLILLIFFLASALVVLYFIDSRRFICPIKYQNDILIRSDGRGDGVFAAERSGRRLHEGLDLYAPLGTPIFACRSGRVSSAKENHGMGKYVVLRHSGGFITIYGHLSQIAVAKNQFVRRGQMIGLVGKTGNADYRDIQPHLHFEVRKGGVPVDPLEYLE